MPIIGGERVAVNPSTGAQVVLRGGSWVPYTPMGGAAPSAATAPAVGGIKAPEAPISQPPTGGGGNALGQLYSQDVAQPLTNVTARAITDVGQSLTHPQQALRGLSDPMQYMQEATKPRAQGSTSPMARSAAEFVIPQTLTAAALDVASVAMPEVGAERVLGEAAGPVSRFLGNRLGRVAGGTAVGAAAGAASGEGPLKGAAQGALSFGPGETFGSAAGKLTGGMGERATIRGDTTKIGKAIGDALPWVGKLEKGTDFERAFMHGDDSSIVQSGLQRLNSVKQTLAQRMKGRLFMVPTPKGMQQLPFDAADKMATELQQGMGFGLGGQERAGYTAREARALAFQIREHIADGLDKTQAGLGRAYRKAGREYDAAKTLTRFFGPEGLVGPQGIDQAEMLSRLRGQKNGRLLYDLDRSMGRGTRERLMEILKRGYVGVSADVPKKPGRHNWMGHAVGAAVGGAAGAAVGHPALGAAAGGLLGVGTPVGGHAFDPIGQVSPLTRFSGAPFEMGISNLMGEQLKPAAGASMGPGMKALDTHRAESLAPTPSASDRAGKVTMDLRKGKTPEVHRDLNRGRLSLDETNKLLKHSASTDQMAMIEGIPLTEVMDSLEVASPEERQMLMPMVQQRLQKELPQEKNKTLQAKLSQRFQRLQQMANQPQQEGAVG